MSRSRVHDSGMGKKRNRRQSEGTQAGSQKVSELIIEYASEYIAMGEDLDDKQSHLNLACSAWNIANLPPAKRSHAIQQYVDKYLEFNTHVQDTKGLRHDIDLLIESKLRMFPDVKKEIAGADISEVDGKEHINIVSIPHGQLNPRSRRTV